MSILDVVYASAPTDEVIVGTLEILVPGQDPVRVNTSNSPRFFGIKSGMVEFEAGPLEIALPKRDTSGNQTLTFGFEGVSGRAQRLVDAALESDDESVMIYREYLLSDPTAPAARPVAMTIVGGRLDGNRAVFEGSYYDLLNSAWPRDRYTTVTAPGIRYMT